MVDDNSYTYCPKKGFTKKDLSKINGPIGIKLGGKSPSEIALSIISQLVFEKYKK